MQFDRMAVYDETEVSWLDIIIVQSGLAAAGKTRKDDTFAITDDKSIK